MRIHLIGIGRRMPGWVAQGFEDYARRLPPECGLTLVELEPGRRGRTMSPAETAKVKAEEGARLLRAVPKGAGITVLDERGRPWSTADLAAALGVWLGEGRDRALLVGGPDGLDASVIARADQRWSLSNLTFPHPLVRVILAEQVYRAWTLLNNHPYHRGT